jgi:hypothetical protein
MQRVSQSAWTRELLTKQCRTAALGSEQASKVKAVAYNENLTPLHDLSSEAKNAIPSSAC